MIYFLTSLPLMMMRTFRTAVVALRRNLMRAVLTTLGIIIGIAAVIATVEIGGGVSRAIQASIADFGANNLIIIPGAASSGSHNWGEGSQLTLTADDALMIGEQSDAVHTVVPVVQTAGQVVTDDGHNWQMNQIVGTTTEYLDVRNWHDFQEGGMFTDLDLRNAARVCVIGDTLDRELFGGRTAVGKQVRIQGVALTVIGVLKAKGGDLFGNDQDNILIAPWRTIKFRLSNKAGADAVTTATGGLNTAMNSLNNLFPTGGQPLYPERSDIQLADAPAPIRFSNINLIQVTAKSADDVPAATAQIDTILRTTHRLRADQASDFQIHTMQEVSQILGTITGLLTLLLLSVAAISLVVGGVGIMNIMLVSVTERTREIGLRMSVGARGRDILLQFLVESVMLCGAGGALGILLGELASWLAVTKLMGWPAGFSPLAVAVAFGVSAAVGITFGFYPAWKASRLDPIEALRYE